MAVLYSNNASSTLASSISNSATTVTVASGEGGLFPAVSSPDYFYATLDNNAGGVEIVKVTARSGDIFTVVRGQDNTGPLAFNAGAKFELRLTAKMLDDLLAGKASLSGTGFVAVQDGGTGRTILTADNVLLGDGTNAVKQVAPGASGNVLTSNGTTWTSAAFSASANIQEFSSTGTSSWTKPAGAKLVHVVIFAGGGGGGGGRRRGAANPTAAAAGGGGGSAGGRVEFLVPASMFGETVTVVVGSGGTGGAGGATDASSGQSGNSGNNSRFGDFYAIAGGGGSGGTTSSGTASGVSGNESPASTLYREQTMTGMGGSTSTSTAAEGAVSGLRAGGGGGGRGFAGNSTTAGNGAAGGRGGVALGTWSTLTGGGGSGGSQSIPSDGAAGADSTLGNYTGGSGGGGGAANSSSATSGGAGGIPGGGGGGGGAASGSFAPGSGGAGARGFVRVTTYF